MQQTGKLYRYPGVKPFVLEEQDIFFGRKEDVGRLYKLLNVEQLVVLYAKSGLGKSSLLQAGLLPRLLQEPHYQPLLLRFGNYVKDVSESPLKNLLLKIKEAGSKPTFLKDLIGTENSAWTHLKNLQIRQNSPDNCYVLIFDQFEELFTYSESDFIDFKRQIAELLNTKIPQRFREIIKNKLDENPDSISKEEKNILFEPLNVKVLIAIRSDKMSLLNKMTDFLPSILNKCYELQPLTTQQAELAITEPAFNKQKTFDSPPFYYSDEALDKILDFLTKDRQKNVESFQLQMLCQYAEEKIVSAKEEQIDKKEITADDLGDLQSIYGNYYDNQIAKIERPEDRTLARNLIEDGLILQEEERRLSLYEGQITKRFKISTDLLQKLVDSHLLRAEPNVAGDLYYELSHDSLVQPILRSKQRRTQQEKGELELKKRQEIFKKRNRKIAIQISIGLSIVVAALIGLVFYQEFRLSATNVKNLEVVNDSLQNLNADLQDETEILAKQYNSKLETANTRIDSFLRAQTGLLATFKTDSTKEADLSKQIQWMQEHSLAKDARIDTLNRRTRESMVRLRLLNEKLRKELYLYAGEKGHKILRDGILEDYRRFENDLMRQYPGVLPPPQNAQKKPNK